MGEGMFGQVLECWDCEKKEMVAIRIVRAIKKYREAAMIDVEMLQRLLKHDKDGNWTSWRSIRRIFHLISATEGEILPKGLIAEANHFPKSIASFGL